MIKFLNQKSEIIEMPKDINKFDFLILPVRKL